MLCCVVCCVVLGKVVVFFANFCFSGSAACVPSVLRKLVAGEDRLMSVGLFRERRVWFGCGFCLREAGVAAVGALGGELEAQLAVAS